MSSLPIMLTRNCRQVPSSLSGPEHIYAETLSSIAQIGILGCERDAESHCQLQISCIIGSQSFRTREIEYQAKSA
jgi:hypothetical protein